MSIFSYESLKKLLFKLEPETAHSVVSFGLKWGRYCPLAHPVFKKRYFVEEPNLRQNLFGREFKNPVGLAAGFDKNAEYITTTPLMGFGFTEVGTITPKPQPGNPKPRLFRLIEERSIQNAMGFNNKGALYALKQIKKLHFFDYPIGINLGKNKITPESEALEDYEHLFKSFGEYGDYLIVNISSPNTPGLRDLQNEAFIGELFKRAKELCSKPVLLKIAPDMSVDDALTICQKAIDSGADGIIATNTTIDYSLSSDSNLKDFGGISGALLKEKSFALFEALAKAFYGKTLLISVGGIEDGADAYRRIRAGATLVQIYSSLIYQGPAGIAKINKELSRLIKQDGFSSITEAIGADRAND